MSIMQVLKTTMGSRVFTAHEALEELNKKEVITSMGNPVRYASLRQMLHTSNKLGKLQRRGWGMYQFPAEKK